MNRLEPMSAHSGYALEAERQDNNVHITFMRSVGYALSYKNTPAFDITVKSTGLDILRDGLKKHPEDPFTMSIATQPSYSKSRLEVEHVISHTSRRPNLIRLNYVLNDGATYHHTMTTVAAFTSFLDNLLDD